MVCRLSRLLLWLILAFMPGQGAMAQNRWFDLPPSVQLHGFLSQAAIHTSDNNFFGETDDNVDFGFREIGLNGSWRILPRLQLSLQVLSREAGGGDDGDLRIDYGFADYSVIADADDLWGIRIGRVTNPLGLYNDTRDVAFTRPSILLPQSIYFDRTRNLALSADGVQLYGERRTDLGDFYLQLNLAYPRTDDPDIEVSFLGADFPGELADDPSFLGRLLYERNGGQLRLGVSGGMVNIDYQAGTADPLTSGSILFAPLIFSAQYNAEYWSLTGEWAIRRFETEDIFTRLGQRHVEVTGESWYIQGSYRFRPDLEGFVRYDVLYTDRDDRDGEEAGPGRPSYSRYAKDFTVGLRWDVTPSFMLRAEIHDVEGTAWLPFQDNPFAGATTKDWTMFMILGSYRF